MCRSRLDVLDNIGQEDSLKPPVESEEHLMEDFDGFE